MTIFWNLAVSFVVASFLLISPNSIEKLGCQNLMEKSGHLSETLTKRVLEYWFDGKTFDAWRESL